MLRLEGKNILVTGASSGIGREMAFLLAAEGHPLVLVGRNEARLEEVAEAVRTELGVGVHTIAADLGQPNAAQELFDRTKALGIEVQLLVNNAGVGLYGEHAKLSASRVTQMLQLNVATLTELCLLYGAEMKERRSGRILNVSSTAAYQPTPFFAAYGASKTFVLNFSEALAMELSDYGVTVSCLSPGPTDTGFFGEMDAQGVDNAHFAKSDRHQPREVAEIGVAMMKRGELSRIVGAKNFIRAWSSRIVTRAMVARIAKGIMVSSSVRGAAQPT